MIFSYLHIFSFAYKQNKLLDANITLKFYYHLIEPQPQTATLLIDTIKSLIQESEPLSIEPIIVKKKFKSKYFSLSENEIALILYRNDVFVEKYNGTFYPIEILQYVKSARYSYVDYLDEDSNISFWKSNYRILLESPIMIPGFENEAFLNRNSQICFGWKKADTYEISFFINDTFSLSFNQNSMTFHEWVQSCITSIKLSDLLLGNKFNFYLISSKQSDLNDYLINQLEVFSSTGNIKNILWNSITAQSLKEFCHISERGPAYVMTYKNKCFVYPDMDVISDTNLRFFFFSNLNRETFYSERLEHHPLFDTVNENKCVAQIPDNKTYSELIPDGQYPVIVFLPESGSILNYEIENFYNSYACNFLNKSIRFFSYRFSQRISEPDYIPTPDGFPTFVLYEPNDRIPIVFNTTYSNEHLKEWIDEIASRKFNHK